MMGSTCKKNARRFRNPRPGKDLRSEKKISCRYALSSRRQGQRPCTPWVAASVRSKLEKPAAARGAPPPTLREGGLDREGANQKHGGQPARKTNPETASPSGTRSYDRHFLFSSKKLS